MTKNEAPIALPARSHGQILDGTAKVFDDLARSDLHEGKVSSIKRLVARRPTHGSLERSRALRIASREEEHAAQRPMMKATSRGGTAASSNSQVCDGGSKVALSQGSARRVLMNYVR